MKSSIKKESINKFESLEDSKLKIANLYDQRKVSITKI